MILLISSLVAATCQGCSTPSMTHGVQSPSPVSEADFRIGETSDAETVPALRAASNFSFSQGQTEPANTIAIYPVTNISTIRPLAVDATRSPTVSSLRMSNAAPVVDYQSRRSAATFSRPSRQISDFDAEVSISAPMERTGLGFDVGVVPRISMTKDGDFKQHSVGGEIRIGQNFDQRGQHVAPDSWYLFAGADGEALVYEPDGDRSFTNRMALRDQVTVGDMQAGVSFTRGSGQLSLSYIHREVEYNERGLQGQRAAEDFAGVSFTLRR